MLDIGLRMIKALVVNDLTITGHRARHKLKRSAINMARAESTDSGNVMIRNCLEEMWGEGGMSDINKRQ